MLLYTCQACVAGHHDLCAGKNPAGAGMLGGSECDCDGNCAARAKPDPQVAAALKKKSA